MAGNVRERELPRHNRMDDRIEFGSPTLLYVTLIYNTYLTVYDATIPGGLKVNK